MRSFYLETPTWLHAVPAWLKLAALSLAGSLLFLFDAPLPTGLAALATALLYASLGRGAWQRAAQLRGLAIVLVLIVAFHAFTDDWRIGLLAATRLATLAVLGLALTLTTRFDELLAVLEAVLSPLRLLGIRTERIALAFGLMLRFIEIFFLRWQQLDDACRVRSGKPGGLKLMAPLAVQALLTAERVGDALSVRLGR
jgi:biotin transport system permease protein